MATNSSSRQGGRHVTWKRSRHVTWKGKAMITVASGLAATAIAPQAFAAGTVAITGVSTYDATSDPYSLAHTKAAIGATPAVTGKGIDVAVIDTGVTPVAGLNGKVVQGPDLALDSFDPALRGLDENGHGTFMAGLIAGDDGKGYSGVAPGARIVNLKVGVADGEVDVSQVIAAIDWVVQNKTAHGMNIRVLSLSYGTNSTQQPGHDPLAYAVERAWAAGIVVVAAAGNTGFQQGAHAPGLADPGYDPLIVTVGSYDTMGTANPTDDTVSTFSASSAGCPSCKAPDLLAPGSHLQGLRVPGSYTDVTFAGGRLGPDYFRGSGTSEATAITAGAVALVLQQHPNLTPDQVKALLTGTARPLPGAPTSAQGAGALDVAKALAATPPPAAAVIQTATPGRGDGSLEASRGTDHVDFGGYELAGERDVQFHPFAAGEMAQQEAAGASWNGAVWNRGLWLGAAAVAYPSWPGIAQMSKHTSPHGWTGTTWSGTTWSGTTWSGTTWSGTTWSGTTWSGSTWS